LFKSCLFSAGDVVQWGAGRFPGVVIGTRPFGGEDIRESTVVVRAVMTGHPVTRLIGGHSGVVKREILASKLSLVCRASNHPLVKGDSVVSFPLIKVPHVSVELGLLEDVYSTSSYTSGAALVKNLSDEGVLSVAKNTIHLPRTKLIPIQVGDLVIIRVSEYRGWQGNVYGIDEEGLLTVGFPSHDKSLPAGMLMKKFKMGELSPYQRPEELGRLAVIPDDPIVLEPRRRPTIYRVFVDEVVV
jgi:hypothetical protein